MPPRKNQSILARLDHKHVWHPFTQMRDWLRSKPIVITRAKGALLQDENGHEYLDANSSIWTNLHGHNHPKINAALNRQLKKIAHSSALGFANEPASLLAEKLVQIANPKSVIGGSKGNPQLEKVFYSDDGSTALEVALKLCHEFTRRTGRSSRPRFLSMDGAYHGDTVGAVSLGHIDLFHKAYSGLLFKTDKVMSPSCYRCPFNRAKPERGDARDYRKCNWECVGKVERAFTAAKRKRTPYAAFVYEPLMQGAAGMIPQPDGWLNKVCSLARQHGAQLIADEVMTGFGRCNETAVSTHHSAISRGDSAPPEPGSSRREEAHATLGKRNQSLLTSAATVKGFKARSSFSAKSLSAPHLFASHEEGVQPDYLCVAKGLTGGYLPMAASLTTQTVFDAFLGEYDEFKSFFHGHSYTGNQLGASAGLANIDLLNDSTTTERRRRIGTALAESLQELWSLPAVGDIRRVGLVAGVELVRDWKTRQPFDLREQAGIRVCQAMARRGVLTRPIGNVIVLMPPYCSTAKQVRQMVAALGDAISETLKATA